MVYQDIFDRRKYEMALHDVAAVDYERQVSDWIIEHKYFISAMWGKRFDGLFLDYGCGTGLVARFIKPLREIVGIGISKNMCKIAKKVWGIDVIVGDCLNLPFTDDAFNVICISGVLHHIPQDLEKAFSEIERCVKEAVCIVKPSTTKPLLFLRPILFLYKAYKWFLQKLRRRLCGKYTYSIFEKPLDPRILINLCSKKGFDAREIRFFNHIPLTRFLPETIRKHLIQSMLSSTHGTDVEIIATRSSIF
ncbi:MAG: class I SAM-dependent methyltransferase [Candidatus Baldrarchaeia archaeon]